MGLFKGEVAPASAAAPSDSKVSSAEPSGTLMDVGEGSTTASSSSMPSSPVLSNEQKLEQLQSLGFTRLESEQALVQAEGEVALAANLLFSSR